MQTIMKTNLTWAFSFRGDV